MARSLRQGVRLAIYIGLIASSLACAQEVTTTMSYSWDQPSGDLYVHAESALDYDSSYYYFVCVGIDLFQTPGSYSGTSNTCDYTDAAIDWYTSVSTDTPLTLDIESENYIWMNYYADQFEGGWPDGYCWDAYQANYFDGTIDDSGGTDYSLPGLPSVGVADQYFTYYEFAEAVSCNYAIVTSAFHTPSCHTATDSGLFGAQAMPSLEACGGQISSSSTCSITDVGPLGVAYPDVIYHGPNGYTCNVGSLGITGTAYLIGPTAANSPGTATINFFVTFTGQTENDQSSTVPVICP